MKVTINDRWIDDPAAEAVIVDYYDKVQRLESEVDQLKYQLDTANQRAAYFETLALNESTLVTELRMKLKDSDGKFLDEQKRNLDNEAEFEFHSKEYISLKDEIEKLKEFISLAFEAHSNLDIDVQRITHEAM